MFQDYTLILTPPPNRHEVRLCKAFLAVLVIYVFLDYCYCVEGILFHRWTVPVSENLLFVLLGRKE